MRRVDDDEEAGQEASVNIARNVGIIALASILSVGMLSAANAADRSRPVTVTRPVAVQPAARLHPVLWCVGGVVVSVVVHNPIPAVVGCAITVVHVHRGYYY
jgi:hypothetical protein